MSALFSSLLISPVLIMTSTTALTLGGVMSLVTGAVAYWFSQKFQRQKESRRLEEILEVLGVSGESSRDNELLWTQTLEKVTSCRGQQLVSRTQTLETRLIQNELARLVSVFRALPMGVIVLNPSQRIVYANQIAKTLLKLPDQDEPSIDQAENHAAADSVRAVIGADLAQGLGSQVLKNENGTEQPDVYQIRSVQTDSTLEQERVQIIIFEDITAQLVSNRMKTEFVYGVSHELKTPLTSIQASLEMLVDEANLDEKDRKRLLDLSYSESIRLGQMVRELLDLARVEAGVTEVKREKVSVKGLMDELASIHHPLASKKSIQMNWKVSDFVPTINGDSGLLLQAFVNIIGNAIKYTRESGEVSVSAELEGEELLIQVKDSGIGISSQDIDRIFDKFYRAGTAKTSTIPGTGLGLPMARFIVETHGGRVQVESEEGEGSLFSVFLPTEEANPDEMEVASLQSFDLAKNGGDR